VPDVQGQRSDLGNVPAASREAVPGGVVPATDPDGFEVAHVEVDPATVRCRIGVVDVIIRVEQVDDPLGVLALVDPGPFPDFLGKLRQGSLDRDFLH